jgi:hypothetical protein
MLEKISITETKVRCAVRYREVIVIVAETKAVRTARDLLKLHFTICVKIENEGRERGELTDP